MIRQFFFSDNEKHQDSFQASSWLYSTSRLCFGVRLILLFAVCWVSVPGWAADTVNKDKLHKVEMQLGEKKEKVAELNKAAAEASEGLKGLQSKLIAATEALQTKEDEEDRIEDHLDQLEQDIADKQAGLAREKHKLFVLTGALIEMGRQPQAAGFLQTGVTTDYIHRALLLQAVLPRIKEQTESIARDILELHEMKRQMDEQKSLLIATTQNLEKQQREMDQLIKARQGSLQRTEAQKQALAAQLVALSGEAQNLRQLMEKVSPPMRHTPLPGAPSGSKMALKVPVVGAVIRPYGTRDADGVVSEGMTFAALPGSPVVAPRAGKVVFAGPFRGYGQVLILQHDGGAHSFLAGFGRIDAEMGQDVATGEPLGVLPVKNASGTSGGRDRTELYFEWRRNNEAVNPAGEGFVLSKNP